MRVEKVSAQEWNKLSESAHLIAFGEERPAWMNTFDFAVVGFDDEKIKTYTTVIELSKDVAYMQHGAAMPETKGTTSSFALYKQMVELLKQSYTVITTRVKSKNVVMLKFALKVGFLVSGCDMHDGQVFVNLRWDK